MRGGVHQAQLTQLQRGEGAAPSLLQPVRQQLQRAERRPHVVHELDKELEAVHDMRSPLSSLQLLADRSEEHTSELQSRLHLVCRLLLEKKKCNPSATPQTLIP